MLPAVSAVFGFRVVVVTIVIAVDVVIVVDCDGRCALYLDEAGEYHASLLFLLP